VDIQVTVRTPQSANRNMQLDQALLENKNGAFLEFHRWEKPSFTHGFFIDPLDEFIFSEKIDIAKRATGGGILYHGKDLSFALCLPDSHPLCESDTMKLYEKLNQLIGRAILDVHDCKISSEPEKEFSFQDPFCMTKATKFDLTVFDKKVLGCAIRRKGGRSLYHCSIPLQMPVADELTPFLQRGDALVEKILKNTYAIDSDWNQLRERIQEHVTKNG